MKMKTSTLLASLLVGLACTAKPPQWPVNLAHLHHLCEEIEIDGLPMTVVRIYSNAPDYQWQEAPGEGIACVDDVARAVVLLIEAADVQGSVDETQLRRLLQFVLAMQAPDGEFYNFITADHAINSGGITSKKSFSFWAARGYWALGSGYRYYRQRDPEFAQKLRRAFDLCLIPLAELDTLYPHTVEIDGRLYPQWLIHGTAADATSEFLLGAAQVLAVDPDLQLLHHVRRLCEGVLAMQVQEHPLLHNAFLSWPGTWHAWGNSQIQALTLLYPILQDTLLLDAAKNAAQFRAKQLISGPISHIDLASGETKSYPLIAYDIRTGALGFLELYRATADEKYAVMAGLAAASLTGANSGGEPLYDPQSGRVYDGIDATGINRNSGAESTIEGLYTLAAVQKVPAAVRWLGAQADSTTANNWQKSYRRGRQRVTLTWDPMNKAIRVDGDCCGGAR